MIKVGDTLPHTTLMEYSEVEGNGCSIGPNPVDVAKAAAAPAAANEWGITLEDSSVDDPSAASGGAVLPEGLFYAFERSAAQPSSSASASSPSGGSTAYL